MNISQKSIIITGAASGIGAALLQQFNGVDCFITAVDLNKHALAKTCAALENSKAIIFQYVGDISNPEAVDGMFCAALEQFGKIDLFIANAGFAYYEKLETADWAHIEKIYQVNTISSIYSILKMKEINQSHPFRVVVIASGMAKLGLPGYALYAATKASVDHFIATYRWEMSDPTALSVVFPIATKTNFFEHNRTNAAPIPWPSQSADYVAQQIYRGIQKDQSSIYPSRMFWFIYLLGRWFPFIYKIEQMIEKRRFENWLNTVSY